MPFEPCWKGTMPSSVNQFGTNIVEDESQRERVGFAGKSGRKQGHSAESIRYSFLAWESQIRWEILSEPYIFPDNEDLQNIEIRSMACHG